MRRPLLALASCAILAASGIQAAEAPGQWYVAPMVSGFWGDSSRFTDDDVGGHLALGHAFEKWNIELGGFYYDLDGNNETEIWGVGLDVLSSTVVFSTCPDRPDDLSSAGFSSGIRKLSSQSIRPMTDPSPMCQSLA